MTWWRFSLPWSRAAKSKESIYISYYTKELSIRANFNASDSNICSDRRWFHLFSMYHRLVRRTFSVYETSPTFSFTAQICPYTLAFQRLLREHIAVHRGSIHDPDLLVEVKIKQELDMIFTTKWYPYIVRKNTVLEIKDYENREAWIVVFLPHYIVIDGRVEANFNKKKTQINIQKLNV